MDEIRRARLQKLDQQRKTSNSRAGDSPASNASTPSAPSSAVPSASTTPAPSGPPEEGKPTDKSAPAVATDSNNSKPGETTPAAAPTASKPPVSVTARALQRIFSLSTVPDEDTSPDSLIWDSLEQAPNKFEFLCGCYDRLKVVLRTSTSKVDLAPLEASLVSYAVVCATSDADEMIYGDFPAWLASSTANWQFVALVIDSAYSQDLLEELVAPIWSKFRTILYSKGVRSEYHNILAATETLVSHKQVVSMLVRDPLFAIKDEYKPADIITKTWFGPYLSLSPIDGTFPMNIFEGLVDLDHENRQALGRIENTMPEVQIIMDRLFSICDKIVRSGPDNRQALLDYFAGVLNKNHKRMASFHVSALDINPDGFMANVAYITTKFCYPFLDFSGAKLDKIDPNYYLFDKSYDVSEETKLVADLEESKKTLADKTSTAPNFITQIFFLAVGSLHYGVSGIYQSETRLKRGRQHLRQQVEHIEETIKKMGDTPVAQQTLARAKQRCTYVESSYLALSAIIHNEKLMAMFHEFGSFVQLWTLHQAQPSYPASALDFNTNEATPIFRSYPEHIVESYVATMNYVGQNLPQIARNSNASLIEGLIFYMECPQFIKNPYLKSQMVDVLFYGAIPQRTYSGSVPGYFVDFFNSNDACQKHLFHALMKIYVDMELTGRSAQFYEKFHTREAISRIMKVLWENPVYQRRLELESINNEDFFVRFTALLLNDSTYMLDEALSKLQDIHRLQQEVEANPTPLDQQERNDEDEENEENMTPEQRLSEAEDRAKQYLELAKGCIDLLSTFTGKVPAPFIRDEIVDRFVSMLDYNLNALVGTKCSELKVRNPEKYGFKPRGLLSTIVRIYLNLASYDEFIAAVARDSESFGTSIFGRADGIMSRHTLVSGPELENWRQFTHKVDTAIQENEDDEEELGDIPDEFLDPLMYTLMKEPVILPSSRTTIDLTTIKSYLLNTPTDPFNRAPLKIEDVIPDTEMKEKIEKFKKEARAAKK